MINVVHNPPSIHVPPTPHVIHNGEIAHLLPTVHVPPAMHRHLKGGEAHLSDSVAFRIPLWWTVLSTVSMAASVYHGYKRNQSVGWALAWGFAGALFPVITPAIALAQGFGKRKR